MYIDYKNDTTGAHEEMQGSDGRGNVSSRSDGREYYNSRDKQRCFCFPFEMTNATATEYFSYWKNTSISEHLVISSATINSVNACRIKAWIVSGTAAGGDVVTPANTNRAKGKDASESEAMEGGAAATGITGLTQVTLVKYRSITAGGETLIDFKDTVRLGKGDALAIQYFSGTTGDVWGDMEGYFE